MYLGKDNHNVVWLQISYRLGYTKFSERPLSAYIAILSETHLCLDALATDDGLFGFF